MEVKKFSNKIFEKGKQAGFTDMEVYYQNSEEFEVTVYQSEVDTYKINTDIGLSFRGIIEGKMGYSYTEKFEDEDVDFIIKNAAQNANETQNDVEESIFEGSDKYNELEDMELKDVEVAAKIDDALNMERLARSFDSRIHSVEYCLVGTSRSKRRIINTKGFDKEESSGIALGYLSLVAKDGEDIRSGDKFKINLDYNKINYEEIVKDAVEEAVSHLNAKTIDSGKYKTILRHDAAVSLLATFASIFSADEVQKGLSLLGNKKDERIASEKLTIIDDPFCKEAPSRYSFDDEGVATYTKNIIENGVLKTLLYNLKTAKKDNVNSTGNGFKASYKSPVDVSPTNMYIVPGNKSFEDEIKLLNKAVLITSLQGLHSGANPVSGDFSLAAEGFLIENGKITMPVEQITVAGNFYKVLMDIEDVLSDFEFSIPSHSGCFGSGSLVVKEMSISGK